MGGKALTNCKTRRYNKDEYDLIAYDVIMKLQGIGFHRVQVVEAYGDKETFGDLDVVVSHNGIPEQNIVELLKTRFESKEIIKNGRSISLEFREFQIDVIFAQPEEFDFSMTYFSFNDLGNLMGRIAHKMGLKYGHDGLKFMMREGTQLVEEITVSMDVRKVFSVLDFDYGRWKKGFQNLEEIFEFVSASKYFNPDIYLFDNMNHRSRVRDAKRPTYNAFLEWCEERRDMEWEDQVFFQWSEDKTDYLPLLFNRFYGFHDSYTNAYKNLLLKRELKSKFNGLLVSELTGLEGKELGMFIQEFKKQFETPEQFETWLVISSQEKIEKRIVNFFNKDEV